MKTDEQASSEPWAVWMVNDYEWYLARSKSEALVTALRLYGNEVPENPTEEYLREIGDVEGYWDFDEVRVVDKAGMERLVFIDDSGEHKCSFREEFDRRLAAGPEAEMFATTEI